ncbi:MAG: RNA polymerase sigma factor [Planctomycetota bacterium]
MGEWSVKQTPEELIEAAVAGQRQAQTALWSAHRRWLAAILIAHKPAWVDVEDLMQDVAVKFITRLNTLRDPTAFKPWLRQIAINAAREAARGPREIPLGSGESSGSDSGNGSSGESSRSGFTERGSGPAGSGSPFRSELDTPPPDRVSLRDEAGGLLAHAQTLPIEFREPLIMRSVHGLGCRQIAEILGLPVTTIETRLTRARRMLREEWLRRIGDDAAGKTGSTRSGEGSGPQKTVKKTEAQPRTEAGTSKSSGEPSLRFTPKVASPAPGVARRRARAVAAAGRPPHVLAEPPPGDSRLNSASAAAGRSSDPADGTSRRASSVSAPSPPSLSGPTETGSTDGSLGQTT